MPLPESSTIARALANTASHRDVMIARDKFVSDLLHLFEESGHSFDGLTRSVELAVSSMEIFDTTKSISWIRSRCSIAFNGESVQSEEQELLYSRFLRQVRDVIIFNPAKPIIRSEFLYLSALSFCNPWTNSRVGFLYIEVENRTDKDITDVYIVLEKLSGEDQNNVLTTSGTEKIFFPIIKPGKKIVRLLYVYVTDQEKFEDKIVLPGEIPISVTFDRDGKTKKMKIRPPKRDEAGKWDLPLGWTWQ